MDGESDSMSAVVADDSIAELPGIARDGSTYVLDPCMGLGGRFDAKIEAPVRDLVQLMDLGRDLADLICVG